MKLVFSAAVTAALFASLGQAAAQSTSPPTNKPMAANPVGPVAPRYYIANARSVKTAQTNVATVVRIMNTNSAPCNYLVRFYYVTGTTSICDISLNNVAAGYSVAFCSRPLPDANNADIAVCDATCSPELDFHSARATVFSTNNSSCARMIVDPLQVWTDTNDTTVLGAYAPKVIKVDPTEVEKASKGD